MTTKTIDRPPVTESRLRRDLANLGAAEGMTLMVHSSLSSIGWVAGGAPAVVRSLLGAIGEQGTLAMPAATPQVADTATFSTCPILLFDPLTTPTEMGAIPEAFRTWPGTLRSSHPLESVCARGPSACDVTEEHALAFSEGRRGPFGKLHELDSRILLLGVGFNRCTALHFAESLVQNRRTMKVRVPTSDAGRRVWVEVPNVADDNDTHFPVIGERYVAAGRAQLGTVGEAPSALFPMRDLVDFAISYFDSVL